MKKIIFLVIFFSLVPLAVFATSGACSTHGGVNCSAGIGNQGANAVCNDGFESSTSYYDTDECIGKLSPCAEPIKYVGCSGAPSYIASCGYPSQYNSNMYDICVTNCKNQVSKYQNDLAIYNSCVANQPSDSSNTTNTPDSTMQGYCVDLFGNNVTYNSVKETCECNAGYTVDSSRKCSLTTCPSNASYINGKCTCNDGYNANNGVCITYNQSCQNQYGINSYGDKNKCYCNAGYQWNASNTVCVQITCSANSSLINNKCVCNAGYYFLENSDLNAAGIQRICVATKETEKKIVEKAISDVLKQPQTVTPNPTPAKKPSKLLEGVTIGQPATPQTKGLDYSKITSDPSVKVSTPPITSAKATTPAVAPKKSIMVKVWDFIKGLFGK